MTLGKLILKNENDEILYTFFGNIIGYEDINVVGECVFTTSHSGYELSVTDPSFANQILIFTFPLLGNYGIPNNDFDEFGLEKNFESSNIHCMGIVMQDYCENPSHYKCVKTLNNWLIENKVPGICNIDTRALTKIIRESKTTIYGTIEIDENLPYMTLDMTTIVKNVSRNKPFTLYNINPENLSDNNYKIICYDLGIKNNIIRSLLKYDNIQLKLVPYNYIIDDKEFETISGIFLSNGPGDPQDCVETINLLQKYFEKNKPIFGICLGHQLMALASGASTRKMKYGNRGCNQSVINCENSNCYVTSQNHGYEVDASTLNEEWREYFINLNDYSNEGIIHKTKPFFSCQHHPEACPGPFETEFLFNKFINIVKNNTEKINNDSYYLNINKMKNKNKIKKILLVGSGGLKISQSGEFDYNSSAALKAFKESNIETVLLNSNIATIQTSDYMCDNIYFLPINKDSVKQIYEKEKFDSIAISFGGQTALNLGLELYKENFFKVNNIRVLGTSLESVILAEDRNRFADLMVEIGEPIARRFIITDIEQIDKGIEYVKFPIFIRNNFCLGGLGSVFINNKEDLIIKVNEFLKHSDNVVLEQDITGWKEVEYEIMRDYNGNCETIVNMENFCPVGIHTGDSIVVSPSQTLNNEEYYGLRKSAIKIATALDIVGECNCQLALNPNSKEYIVIEVNPRLSRSSALASKASGIPIAYQAAKILIGEDLNQQTNLVTKTTSAFFEPALDYIVVKIPKFEFNKFQFTDKILNSAMKSIGEVMAIGRNFEETIQKGLRMVDDNNLGFICRDNNISKEDVIYELKYPSDKRLLMIDKAFDYEMSVDEINHLTKIDKFFLNKLLNIHKYKLYLQSINDLNYDDVIKAKKLGFSDKGISYLMEVRTKDIYEFRRVNNIRPFIKMIDTSAGEFRSDTNYLYLTYNAIEDDVERLNNSVIVLGSGSYKIGSSVEFDWSSVQSVNTLKKNKINSIIINFNPETVSTDHDVSVRLYFDEISEEIVTDIYNFENPHGVIISVGGQIPNNLAIPLYNNNIKILGTHPKSIDACENREKFSKMLDELEIDQPVWRELEDLNSAINFCNNVEYPCLIRPSYVLSGAAMQVVENDEQLQKYLQNNISTDYPVVISKFITEAKEIEIDAVAANGILINYGISEHLENAGTHSGDATILFPAQKIYLETIKRIKKITKSIAQTLNISGPFNIQFMSRENEIKVIECNLRASRSMPFISKTLNCNLIELATNIMINKKFVKQPIDIENIEYVCIKMPLFSFNRLNNVDPLLGVDMASTGEIACYSRSVKDAFMKSLLSTNFKLPKQNILVTIGNNELKYDFKDSILLLQKLNFTIYCTNGTYDFYKNLGLKDLQLMDNSFYVIQPQEGWDVFKSILEQNKIELVINFPNNKYCSNNKTFGYKLRRYSIDNGVSLLTNIKFTKLFVLSLDKYLTKKNEILSYKEYTEL